MVEISRTNLKRLLEEHYQKNQEILNSSFQKNIVVFVGKTGSGKSTLLNFLTGKELIVDNLDNIILKNPNEQNSMKIGVKGISETLFPKYVESDGLIYYDLPGLNDTRGTAVSLVNAAFIKNIIENALTVRIVFVSGQDEMTAGRGILLKELLASTKKLIPDESIEEISALIVTKSSTNQNIQHLAEKLKEKTDEEAITKWNDAKRLGKMEVPNNKVIFQGDRQEIINIISRIVQKRINKVNIEVVFNHAEQNDLKRIYLEEMEEIIETFFRNKIDMTNISILTLSNLEETIKILNVSEWMEMCNFGSSNLVRLLREISEEAYDASLIEIEKKIKLKIDHAKALIEKEIKERERCRAIQQQKENDPANWPLITENQSSTNVIWGQEYLGDWEPYIGGSGISRRTKHRKQYYEKELVITTVRQRDIRRKLGSDLYVISQDWHEISSEIRDTGNRRATGKFVY